MVQTRLYGFRRSLSTQLHCFISTLNGMIPLFKGFTDKTSQILVCLTVSVSVKPQLTNCSHLRVFSSIILQINYQNNKSETEDKVYGVFKIWFPNNLYQSCWIHNFGLSKTLSAAYRFINFLLVNSFSNSFASQTSHLLTSFRFVINFQIFHKLIINFSLTIST